MNLKKPILDKPIDYDILSVEEAAKYLRKSPSWVYKNWKILGGRKLGGSLLFPSKEDLYECLFGKSKGVEVRLHTERRQVHKHLVQDKKRSKTKGSRKKEGSVKESDITSYGNPDRHGIFRTD